jgi:hypothetical protein
MTTLSRFVRVALLGTGVSVSPLAVAETSWLQVTSLPTLRDPGSHAETLRAVRSQKEWSALWQPFDANSSSKPRTVPFEVNFAKYTVLLAALGTRPSGGYTVIIRNARDDGTVIHVSVLEVRPRGKNCAVPTELTYPTTAVLIPHTEKAIRFEMASADLDCTSYRSIIGG